MPWSSNKTKRKNKANLLDQGNDPEQICITYQRKLSRAETTITWLHLKFHRYSPLKSCHVKYHHPRWFKRPLCLFRAPVLWPKLMTPGTKRDRGIILHGRYMKGSSFLWKRVMIWTSERSLPVQSFIEYPLEALENEDQSIGEAPQLTSDTS